jgi:PAS domain S-box-containing protein
MKQKSLKSAAGLAGLVGLLLLLASPGASAASPKRVLILDPFDHEAAPFSVAASSFRTTLARELGEPVDFYEVPLDLARFTGSEGEGPLVTFMEGRIKSRPVDLVVPIGWAGAQFAARYRERLFSDTPILVVAADPRMIPPGLLKTNATLVTQQVNLPGFVEDMLQMQPQTTNIVVVFGTSAVENFWVSECRREFQSFTNRVGFTWLNDLPLDQVLKRCATLPPHSFIFYGLFVVDAAGVPCSNGEPLRKLHAVANAPVFGIFASDFSLGTIGGRLYQDTKIGEQGARVAIRILHGENPGNIPPQVFAAAAPAYDWRELHRWGISEANLQAGSVIQFRQPGFWELYRWWIIGTAAISFVMSALIISLLVSLARRRQVEAEATLIADISTKFVNVPSGAVDSEIMEAERRIGELLDLDLLILWQLSDESPGCFSVTHCHSAPPGRRSPEPLRDEDYPWFKQELVAGRIARFASLEELPAEAARDRESFRQLGAKSNLSLPLLVGGGPMIGAFCLNATRAEREWPDELVKRLQLVAQIFANALARKVADQALRESKEQLSLAADAAGAGLWGLNLVTGRFWVTSQTRKLFEFTADEPVTFDRFLGVVHPEDRKLIRQTVQATVQAKSDSQVEYRIVRSDGSQRWMLSLSRADRGKSGQPETFTGISMDITSRKAAERAQRDNEARLASAIEAAALGFYDMSIETKVLFVDDRLCVLLGLPDEERHRVFEFWQEHLHPEERPRIMELSQQGWRGESGGQAMEYRYLHPQRGTIWLSHISRVQEQAADGRAIRRLGVICDITGRKEAEAELQRLRLQLWHADRVAQTGAITASLAHELNQPLTGILSTAQAGLRFLAGGKADRELIHELLTNIVHDTKRAGAVINGLRALLRRKQTQREPINLAAAIQEILDLLHSELVNREVELCLKLKPDATVLADKAQLQQVVLNLAMNALEAMHDQPGAERRLEISLTQSSDGDALVAVCDSGPGMPEERQAKLFEAFWTTKPHGMGIGLAISRSIIESHGGRLWFAKNADRGATFYFTLPLSKSGEGTSKQ